MNIQVEIEKILAEEGFTMKQLADKLSSKNKQITEEYLLKRFSEEKIKFSDVQLILDILDYRLRLKKRS